MSDFFELTADEQSKRLAVLARNALKEWGVVDCIPRLIKYRENGVFEVITADRNRAVLRVHRQGYHSNESLASELEWMNILAQGGLVVPEPIPANSGDIVVNGTADGVPGTWKVDMLCWLEGKELGAVGEPLLLEGRDTGKLFFDIGKIMGTLHNLSTQWPGQNLAVRHAWDCDGFVGEEPLWGHFWKLSALTTKQRSFFLDVRKAIARDLERYGRTADNYGLIHADLVPENIMLNNDEIQLIDFDDAGFGWHMFEIVTAVFWLTDEPDYDIICDRVLEGYQSVRRLRQRDIDTMELFYAARSLTYMGWVHTRRNTETAMELTPFIVENAEKFYSIYMSNRK